MDTKIIFLKDRIKELEKENSILRQQQIEITEAKELYLKIFEEFPALIWRSRLDKLCDYFNKTWLDFTGRTMEQEFGNGWAEGVHPDDFDFCLQTYVTAFDKKQSFLMEYRMKNKFGEYCWIRDFGRPFYDLDNTFLGYIGSCYDITENKNNELKLIELNATKDKFFSIIAHDLRSPFNGFLGMTQIMTEELPSLTMAQVQKLATSMKKSATNLFSLLNNLLEWSQIQQGAIPINPEVIQLGVVVAGSIEMIQELAKNKGIEISTDIADGLEVFADQNMLQTVIRNLVSNAVKFTRKGGNVSISAKTTGDKNVEISVQDTGIGMSPEIVENLFRIDVKTNRKGTDGEPSAGLGLLLCKEFIEKHAGKIWVESEEGIGSTFYFTLPYNIAPIEKSKSENGLQAEKADSYPKNLKILIVEDDETSELFLNLIVNIFGKEILTARTGLEAVEVCKNNPDIDLILMDIQLPELNGYKATEQIRQFNKDVIIIAQTAFGLSGDREKAINAGCNDYITKPIKKVELLLLIQRYFVKIKKSGKF